MSIGPEALIYAFLGVGAFLIVEGLYLAIFGEDIKAGRKLNRRMQILKSGKHQEEAMTDLRKQMHLHNNVQDIPFYAIFGRNAHRAALPFTPVQLMSLVAGLMVLSFIFILIFTSVPLMAAIVLSVMISGGGIYAWVAQKANTRISRIEEQLPEAVEQIVRALKVGQQFNNALATVSRDMQDPLATELALVADAVTYGKDMPESLHEIADRTGIQDFRFIAVAVSIQQSTGGNLAETLDNLAKIIRYRFRFGRRIRAITAEARFTGQFLTAFPAVVVIGFAFFKPEHFDPLKDSPFLVPIVIGILFMLLINIVVMKKITQITV